MLADPHREFEIRCPIHGFITLNDWEREIIEHRSFQRLRRIRQLAWADHVYPGAMHTRFEHSLGVMHTATRLYDAICRNSQEILKSELAYNPDGLNRDKQLVRLTALLHDVGHAPFSHAAEDLLPSSDSGVTYRHEQYSSQIVRDCFREVIEQHPLNKNYNFKADDIAALLEGRKEAKHSLFWRDLIDGQMDADRTDYLLRDSHHAGVEYGKFDLNRLVPTTCTVPGPEGASPRLGIKEKGWHSAEALVLARYFMFTQVYFHKTRIAYDIHLRGALKELLPDGVFPPPTGNGINQYLEWDDWKVLGHLHSGGGGEHGRRLAHRDHFREIYSTPEIASQAEMERLAAVKKKLGQRVAAEESAAKSWYKTGDPDIQVISGRYKSRAEPLSRYSSVVKNLAKNNQVRLYAKPEDAGSARKIAEGVGES